jgi:hypothetical protein
MFTCGPAYFASSVGGVLLPPPGGGDPAGLLGLNFAFQAEPFLVYTAGTLTAQPAFQAEPFYHGITE